MQEKAPEHPEAAETFVRPLVIDLGKRRRKTVRGLKRGRGKLMAEVLSVLDEVRAEARTEDHGNGLLPVIVLYERKRGRGRRRRAFFC